MNTTPSRSQETQEKLGRVALALGAILAVCMVFRLIVIAGYPMGVDQGVFAWFGRVVASGGRPYVDAWDTKGPGVFAIMGVLSVLAPGIAGMRAFDVLLQLAAVVVLVRFPVGANTRVAGYLAAGTFLAGYSSLGFHETAQPDCWANALLVIGIVPLLNSCDNDDTRQLPPLLAIASLCVGIVVLFKPTYAALVAVPAATGLWSLLRDRERTLFAPSVFRTIGFPLAGFALPLAACLGWLAYLGATGGMWDVVIKWNSSVYAGSDMVEPRMLAYSTVNGFLSNVQWWPIAICSSIALLSEWRQRRAVLVMLWAAMALLEIAAQRKFWGYHWTPLLGPIAVGVSFLVPRGESVARWRIVRFRAGAILAILAALYGTTRAAWHERVRLLDDGSSRVSLSALEGYDQRLRGFDDLTRTIRRETAPDDRVYFFGTMAIGNYVSNRPSVGRLSMSRPLLDGAGTALRESYRQEFWALWRSKPPAIVVGYSPAHCERFPALRWTCLPAYPDLQNELSVAYGPPEEIGGFVVYRRR